MEILTQNSAIYEKNMTFGSKKFGQFFTENWTKSLKIVTIMFTPPQKNNIKKFFLLYVKQRFDRYYIYQGDDLDSDGVKKVS
jgi:hypothetical protein